MDKHEDVNMIVIKLREVAQAKGYGTMSEFQRASGAALVTVRRWWKDEAKGIDFQVLDNYCTFLGVEPGDLIQRTQTNQEVTRRG